MKIALTGLLVLAVAGSAAHAQPQRFNSDFSTMQEAEISEVPRNRAFPLLDTPIPARPAAPPASAPPAPARQ